jgi:hypothetical protein
MAAVDDALGSVASALRGAAPTPEAAVRETVVRAREHHAYERGHTTITTSARRPGSRAAACAPSTRRTASRSSAGT